MIWSRAAACSFACRVWLKKVRSSSARETGASRSSIGSFFFAGMRKCPSFLSSFMVDSHQRLNSGSLKTSPNNQPLICAWVAFPPRLWRMFRITPAALSLSWLFSAGRSVAFWARKCSAGIGARFSAAYCSCMGWAFFFSKSIRIWLRRRFQSATRPKPQLLCRQKLPGLSWSSCSALAAVSFPESTNFCSSASMKMRGGNDARGAARRKPCSFFPVAHPCHPWKPSAA